MANYNDLKTAIDAVIKTNGRQEISGAALNTQLKNMVSELGTGYQYKGVATPTNPGSAQTPDYKCFYLATTPGTYTNLGGLVVADGEVAILKWDTSWTKEVTGVASADKLNQLGQQVIYDVSANNGGATFASLSALLSSENLSTLIPIAVRCGGMNIRFIQTSNNRYVQYRYMETDTTTVATFTGTANWQGVDDEPVGGSDNLVKSEGIFKKNREIQLENNGFSISFENKSYVRLYFGVEVPANTKLNIAGDYVNSAVAIYLIPISGEPILKNIETFPLSVDFPIIGIIPINNDSGIFTVDGLLSSIPNKVQGNSNQIQNIKQEILSLTGYELEFVNRRYSKIYFDGLTIPAGTKIHKTAVPLYFQGDNAGEEVLRGDSLSTWTATFDVTHITPTTTDAGKIWVEPTILPTDAYSKAETDNLLAQKANVSDVYTKVEISGLLNQKANASDVDNSFGEVNSQMSSMNDTLSTLVESATPLSQINKIVNAADFGFDPEATASTNTNALNTALYGGNKTIIVSKSGTYKLNNTIRLYDNTTLICANGVVLQKDSVYSHVFLNEGAEARRENKNINLFGLNIDVNGKEAVPARNTALYGLRAHVALLCTKDVTIKDFTCTTIGNNQYCIQANTFDGLYIYNVNIEGAKDGIHLSDGNNVVIKNGIINTQDDPVAFNSSDWDSSNCVDGTIQNAIVENLYLGDYNGSSGHVRMLVGAWVDWYNGMSIKRGDRVVSNGRVYRACTNAADGTVYTSQTEPTTTDYSAVQNDAGGFIWKLMKSESYYQTNVRNITIRNCVMTGHSAYPMCEVDTTSVWNRSLYPDVAIADYPSISEITIEDCQLMSAGGSFYSHGYCNTSFVFERCKIRVRLYCVATVDSALYAHFNFNNMHFIGQGNDDCIFVGSGCIARIFNCQTKNNLVSIAPKSGSTTESDGRIISNCNIDKIPLGAVKGDTIIINNIPKIYNGSSWVSLI